MRTSKKNIIFIVGPTGAGKTHLGLALSGFFPCEFISADSMQVYQGMDIITDKLSKELCFKYPHHLVDIIPPEEEFNAALFCKTAKIAINKVIKNGKVPVVIGGTGLYINSLIYGIFDEDSKSAELREHLNAISRERGIHFLYAKLKEVDPEASAKINPNDLNRIVRGLEVYELTKKQISVLQKQKAGLIEDFKIHIFGIRRDRSDLYMRINQRVDFMVNAGLLGEVSGLLKKKLSKTAYFCIGVREMEGFLDGRYDLAEAIRLIKRNSRHFAKRQMTWFNKNKDIEWIDVAVNADMDAVAKDIYIKITKLKIAC